MVKEGLINSKVAWKGHRNYITKYVPLEINTTYKFV